MIAANTAIFRSLDKYCLAHEDPLSNAGAPRWIRTTSFQRQFLMHAVLVEELSFSPTLKLARFDFSNRALFISSGFDSVDLPASLQVHDIDGGVLTAFLSEVHLAPMVPPSQIRNAIEVADKDSTPGYDGHDPVFVSSLYPKMQAFSVEDLLAEESFKIFFLICLSDRRAQQWIDSQLAEVLSLLIQLNPASIPYRVLCGSVLETEPSALFLAFYRCLEALYAHTQTRRLMDSLEISKPWTEMAHILEETLGWYPREEQSLERLLGYGVVEDLKAVASAMNVQIPSESRPSTFVAKRIYLLRNAVVHYRPFHQKFSFKETNWNRLCEAMALIVLHIYSEVK